MPTPPVDEAAAISRLQAFAKRVAAELVKSGRPVRGTEIVTYETIERRAGFLGRKVVQETIKNSAHKDIGWLLAEYLTRWAWYSGGGTGYSGEEKMATQIWLATSGQLLRQRKTSRRTVTGYSPLTDSYSDLREAEPYELTALDYKHRVMKKRKGREEIEYAVWDARLTSRKYPNPCQGLSVALTRLRRGELSSPIGNGSWYNY